MTLRTESESESEFQTKIRGNRTTKEFKWTPKTEAKLEEILMKNEFEFKEGSLFFEGALALKELLWRRSACGDLRNMLLSACPMWSQYIQSTALSKSKSKWVRLD